MNYQQTINDIATRVLEDAKRVSCFSNEIQEAMGLTQINVEHMALLSIGFFIYHLHVEIYASSTFIRDRILSIETPKYLLLTKMDPAGDKKLWEYAPVSGVPFDYLSTPDLMSKIIGNLKAGRQVELV